MDKPLKKNFFILIAAAQLCGCTLLQPQNSKEAQIAQIVSKTLTAIAALPAPELYRDQSNQTNTERLEVTEPPANLSPNFPIGTPTFKSNESTINGINLEVKCGESIKGRILQAPEFTKDLFEHHASGIFLIAYLEMTNLTNQPIQVWDGDYSLEGQIDHRQVFYTPQKAATGYLFIVRGKNLYQDQLLPGKTWKTFLAFDVDPQIQNWVLIVKPGSEINQQVCELRIQFTK